MRTLALSVAMVAIALTAGCAQMRSGTSAMGASPSTANVYCRDGAWVSSTGMCGSHGGVERVMSAPESQK